MGRLPSFPRVLDSGGGQAPRRRPTACKRLTLTPERRSHITLRLVEGVTEFFQIFQILPRLHASRSAPVSEWICIREMRPPVCHLRGHFQIFTVFLRLCFAPLCELEKTWPVDFEGAFSGFAVRQCDTHEHFWNALAKSENAFRQGRRILRDYHTKLGNFSNESAAAWKQPMVTFPTNEDLFAKPFPALQRLLHKQRAAVDLHRATTLPTHPTMMQKQQVACIMSSSGAGAMGWALSASSPFPNRNFIGALLHWLGARTPEEEVLEAAICPCGERACTPTGPSHVGYCPQAAGVYRIRRHNALQDAVSALCKENGLRPALEQRAQTATPTAPPDIDLSRTDILIPGMLVDANLPKQPHSTIRLSVHLDTAIVEAASHRAINIGSAKVRGSYAADAASKKAAHYTPLMPPGVKFLPAVMETNGFMDWRFRSFLRLLTEHVTNTAQLGSDVSDEDRKILRGALLNQYYQRISTALQLAVTNCIFSSAHRLAYKLASAGAITLPTTHKLKARAQVIIGNAIRSINAPLRL